MASSSRPRKSPAAFGRRTPAVPCSAASTLPRLGDVGPLRRAENGRCQAGERPARWPSLAAKNDGARGGSPSGRAARQGGSVKIRLELIATTAAALMLGAAVTRTAAEPTADNATDVYQQRCARCHDGGADRAPERAALKPAGVSGRHGRGRVLHSRATGQAAADYAGRVLAYQRESSEVTRSGCSIVERCPHCSNTSRLHGPLTPSRTPPASACAPPPPGRAALPSPRRCPCRPRASRRSRPCPCGTRRLRSPRGGRPA